MRNNLLHRIHSDILPSIGDKPMQAGLKYSVPARGGWTIVHVGMLMPEVHEIFVCAAGCLRGVVLSAAEMNLMSRFSTVAIEEHNVLNGDMEELFTEGVTDILNRLPKLPPAVMVYCSCIHLFMGCDLNMCFRELKRRFPKIDFIDCYMIPTMRKSGLTPDQIMRRNLYQPLESRKHPAPNGGNEVLLVGNCFSMGEDSDIYNFLKAKGSILHQITDCKSYEEYLKLSECNICITTQPVALEAGKNMQQKLNMTHIYLPQSFEYDTILSSLQTLAETLQTEFDSDAVSSSYKEDSEKALATTHNIIGDTPIAIDYTFTSRPLELAKLLLVHGFNVTHIFADSINSEEKEAHEYLKRTFPSLKLIPTVHASMRIFEWDGIGKTLALGQKAAYFTDSRYFVNLVEDGGLYGFSGITRLASLMVEAFNSPKDTEKIIRMKGLGCDSCL